MTRRLWVLIHRWAGLTMAVFLILVGLTGSLLAFYPELERLINPQYYPGRSSGEPLGLGELAERVQRRVPEARVNVVILEANQGATLASVGPRSNGEGKPSRSSSTISSSTPTRAKSFIDGSSGPSPKAGRTSWASSTSCITTSPSTRPAVGSSASVPWSGRWIALSVSI